MAVPAVLQLPGAPGHGGGVRKAHGVGIGHGIVAGAGDHIKGGAVTAGGDKPAVRVTGIQVRIPQNKRTIAVCRLDAAADHGGTGRQGSQLGFCSTGRQLHREVHRYRMAAVRYPAVQALPLNVANLPLPAAAYPMPALGGALVAEMSLCHVVLYSHGLALAAPALHTSAVRQAAVGGGFLRGHIQPVGCQHPAVVKERAVKKGKS